MKNAEVIFLELMKSKASDKPYALPIFAAIANSKEIIYFTQNDRSDDKDIKFKNSEERKKYEATFHAEQKLLRKLEDSKVLDYENIYMLINIPPCAHCIAAIENFGIKNVYFFEDINLEYKKRKYKKTYNKDINTDINLEKFNDWKKGNNEVVENINQLYYKYLRKTILIEFVKRNFLDIKSKSITIKRELNEDRIDFLVAIEKMSKLNIITRRTFMNKGKVNKVININVNKLKVWYERSCDSEEKEISEKNNKNLLKKKIPSLRDFLNINFD